MRHIVGKIILLLVLSLLLVGCADFVDQDQINTVSGNSVVVDADHSVGQTFVAHHGGLNAIEFYLDPEVEGAGTLILHLRANSLSDTDILTSSVPISSTSQPGFYHFSLPPIRYSHSEYYYAFLEQRGPGQTYVFTGDLAAYLDGTLYYDHQPQESQTVFRLSYTPGLILLDLLLMVMGWIGYGTATVVVLFLAGYGIVRRWARQTHADFTAVLILSMASALSAWMVALVWFSVFHVHLSAWGVRSLVGIATLSGLCLFVRDKDVWQKRTYWLGKSFRWTLALWVIVFLSIGLRLFIGRDMVMLPGSDTYHHTLIAQLFAEQGGIPNSYEPYAPLISFSYHFGFHSIVALSRWLFGTELLLTTKTVALVLNGAIAATVGLLAERLAGHRRAGVIAAALVGLIMVSPFCLLRWGRFTQTAGLLFLPVVILLFFERRVDTGWILPVLVTPALVFSHNRVAFFAVLFIAIDSMEKVFARRRQELHEWRALGFGSLVCALPWLVRIIWIQYDPDNLRFGYKILEGYNNLMRLEIPVLSFVTNWPVIVLCCVSAAFICLKKRQLEGKSFVIWVFVLVGGGFWFFELTGSFYWDLKTSLLSISVPLAVLIALAGDQVWAVSRGKVRIVSQMSTVTGAAIMVVLGFLNFPALVHDRLIYLRHSDLVASTWVTEHIPESAVFVVNSVQLKWSPGWYIGIDGGYWIPLLSHRVVTLPPMIYAWEWGNRKVLPARLEACNEIFDDGAVGRMPSGAVLRTHGITHVLTYSSQRPLRSEDLLANGEFKLLYHQDRLWIFEVVSDSS